MRVFLILVVCVVGGLFCVTFGAGLALKSDAPGLVDGNQKEFQSRNMQTAYYDWRVLIPASITSDTMKFDSIFGSGVVVRDVQNETFTDGKFVGITARGTIATCHVLSYVRSGTLPSITKMIKAGTTIDTMLLYIQFYGNPASR